MEYLDRFFNFVSGQHPYLIYLALFFGAFLENLIPVIPGDSIIVFGAYMAGLGILGAGEAFVWIWLGSFSGCMLVYLIGYYKGRSFFVARSRRVFSDARFAQAERWFARYGGKLIVFSRFIPGVRAVIGISAGLSRVRPLRMGIYVALGTLIWNGILVYLGILLGTNWKLIIKILAAYNRAMILLLLVGACAAGAVWYRRTRLKLGKKGAGDGDGSTRTDGSRAG